MRLAPVLVALAAVAHAAPVAPANNNDKRQVFTISIPNPFAPQSSTVVPPPVVTTTPPPVVTTTTTPPAVTTTTPPAVTTTSHAPSNEPSSSSIAPPSVVPPSSSSTTTTTSATPTTTSAAPSSTTSTTSSEVSSSAEPSSSQPPTQVTVTEHGSSAVESSHSATAAPSNSKKESLSTGAIAGIAVGGGLALIAIITAIVLFARRRRHDDDDAIRWPELNRHGDSSTMAALPAHRTGHHGIDTGPADRRMSLGSDLDGPAYMQDDHTPVSALNGSSFGSPAGLHDYNEKASYFDPAATTSHHSEGYNSGPIGLAPGEVYHPSSHSAGSYGEHDDYTSYPPAVRPQPSPVHGVADYDWEQAQSQDPYGGYVGATRQESPPSGMTGVGSYPNRY